MFQMGVGIGRLVRARTDLDEILPTVGKVAVATQAGVGFRVFVHPQLALGLDLDVLNWHGTGPAGCSGSNSNQSFFGTVPGPSAAGFCLCFSVAGGFAP